MLLGTDQSPDVADAECDLSTLDNSHPLLCTSTINMQMDNNSYK